ncbi:golgin subfamily A member 7 [Manacus vitellinus]|uniref:golgin subfamily A member 7 n=1 Tax=Manacus vitellinus TaxID=328815 RepID=UPI00115E31F4|nr:golgin subfamily A member 7 [Manacus vitellinus]
MEGRRAAGWQQGSRVCPLCLREQSRLCAPGRWRRPPPWNPARPAERAPRPLKCCLKCFRFARCCQIDRQQFEETVRTLNNLYAEAEKLGGQSYLEGCLACLTAYTIFLCMETHYEKVLKKIAKFIQEQNEKIYAPQGLLLTDPIERGLRVIEITIYEDRGLTSGR